MLFGEAPSVRKLSKRMQCCFGSFQKGRTRVGTACTLCGTTHTAAIMLSVTKSKTGNLQDSHLQAAFELELHLVTVQGQLHGSRTARRTNSAASYLSLPGRCSLVVAPREELLSPEAST